MGSKEPPVGPLWSNMASCRGHGKLAGALPQPLARSAVCDFRLGRPVAV
jgi:hypothetical protein